MYNCACTKRVLCLPLKSTTPSPTTYQSHHTPSCRLQGQALVHPWTLPHLIHPPTLTGEPRRRRHVDLPELRQLGVCRRRRHRRRAGVRVGRRLVPLPLLLPLSVAASAAAAAARPGC